MKGSFDAFAARMRFFPHDLSDRVMQATSRFFPKHLPRRMTEYRDRYEHHLMLKMAGTGIGDARDYLQSIFPSAQGDFFECTDDEGEKAFLHRLPPPAPQFATARSTTTKSRISSHSTSRYGATIEIGSRLCPTRSRSR
jgi:hypothetical protein